MRSIEPSLSCAVTLSLLLESLAPGLAAEPAAAFPVLPPFAGEMLDPVELKDLPGASYIVFDGSNFLFLPFLPFLPFFFFFFFSFLRL